jgi:hypothetical protein
MNGGATQERAGFARAVPWIGLAIALVPFLVSIVVLLIIGGRFHAVSDQAIDEMLTRDVGRHMVLLGPFSQYDWNHPGPAMFYALALPYRLAGGNSADLWIGALLINAAAVATMALIAKRLGGTALMMLTLLGCVILMRTLGADFLRNPWNPYLPVLSFGALIFLVWAMACGEAWALPVAAAVATFCAQTHISYVVLALPLFVGGAVWLLWVAKRGGANGNVPSPSTRSLARAGSITGAVLAVMWLPPLFEELTRPAGNLTKAVRYFRDPPPGAHHSLVQGFRVVGSEFWIVPEWVRGLNRPDPFSLEPTSLYRSPLPLLLIAFVAGGIVLWRSRRSRPGSDERGWRLAVIVAVTLVLGIVSVARTVGPAFAYRLGWSPLIAMLAMVVAAWGGWRIIEPRASTAVRRSLMFLSLLTLGVLVTVDTVAAIRAGTPQRTRSETVSTLAASALAALPSGDGDVLVRTFDPLTGYQAGLVLWLERHGVSARVDPVNALSYGSHRVHHNDQPLRAVITIASDLYVDDLARRKDQRLIAIAGAFSARRRHNVVAKIARLDREFKHHELDIRTYILERGALANKLNHVTAIFLQEATTQPAPNQR